MVEEEKVTWKNLIIILVVFIIVVGGVALYREYRYYKDRKECFDLMNKPDIVGAGYSFNRCILTVKGLDDDRISMSKDDYEIYENCKAYININPMNMTCIR